jgi:hypothetical protein
MEANMPQYFFNTRVDGELVQDEEGIDFQDLDAAKVEAEDSLRILAAEDIKAGTTPRARALEICDDGKNVLAVISMAEVLAQVVPPSILKE